MAILEVRGLTKRFGGLPAVDDLHLDVEVGQVLAVIGPNGAGKSTLLKLVGGVLTPTSCQALRLRGTELTGRRPHRIRRLGVATVQQTPRAFPSLSVLDNAALGAMFGGRERVAEARARAAAMEQLELLGLADRWDATVGELTLRERRTLELARALTGTPQLLLLDEVMAGLNPAELERFIAVVRGAIAQLAVSVVWVEHVMRAVTALADRVLVLHLGRRLAEGVPAVVMRDRAVVEAYLGQGAQPHAEG